MLKTIKRLEQKPLFYQLLRFLSIGLINTSFNFLVLNLISKALNVDQGLKFGLIEAVAFCAALLQSYFWNRTWTFSESSSASTKINLMRLSVVAFLGAATLAIIFFASHSFAPWQFYCVLTFAYLLAQFVIWRAFRFHESHLANRGHSFASFFIVTLVGLLINVSLISVISIHLNLTGTDLDKNLAAVFSSFGSLAWNFLGYKKLVFKN